MHPIGARLDVAEDLHVPPTGQRQVVGNGIEPIVGAVDADEDDVVHDHPVDVVGLGRELLVLVHETQGLVRGADVQIALRGALVGEIDHPLPEFRQQVEDVGGDVALGLLAEGGKAREKKEQQ